MVSHWQMRAAATYYTLNYQEFARVEQSFRGFMCEACGEWWRW